MACRGKSVQMLNIHLKLFLFALATCLIGGGTFAQSEQSKSELLEDLLSGSDVCVNLGYVSEDGVNTERLEYEKKLMSVNQQLAEALAELDTIKSEAGESNSSSMDERLDFLRDAAMQCEMKYAALSEEQNSGVEDLGKALTLYKKTIQRLLNEKNCDAGLEDGVIGGKTVKAAENFALSSGFRKKYELVYDEEFFEHLNNSKSVCSIAQKDKYAGNWRVKSVCSNRVITATVKIEKINSFSYRLTDYVNNMGDRAYGTGTVIDDYIKIVLKFDGSTSTATLRGTDDKLEGESGNGCEVEAFRD